MRLASWCALAMLSLAATAAGSVELYDASGQFLDTGVDPPAGPFRRQPVLFVHGHADDSEADPNYKKNFWADDGLLALLDLTSFKSTLDASINSGLDIEPYYIRFDDRTRSITDDAADIGQVVDYIIKRHNTGFEPAAASAPPPVQLAVIAYSKGTLSTRQYLKSLQQQVSDDGGISMPAPRPAYRPVSEFVAISPPNHGIASSAFDGATDQISVQQLYNGVQPEGSGCGTPFNPLHPQARNFIEILNGDTVLDSQVPNAGQLPNEAPGSRSSTQGPHSGVLYVTLFAAGNADFVGGDTPPSPADCAGRALASNLSADAVNIPIGQIPGIGPLTVHANTVHFPRVVCLALFVVTHHRPPPQNLDPSCTDPPARIPTIPLPQPAAAMLALDISGSMLARECAACPTRYDILRQAVEIFAQLWTQMGRANDRLGVTYFRTTIDEPLIGTERLPVLAGNIDTLIADVNGQNVVAANRTAMGGGLQRSVVALAALAPEQAAGRHVILFSDGMQNVNPMVLAVPNEPTALQIDDQPGRLSSGIAPQSPPMRLDALAPLKVDTIAVGAGAFVSLLGDIAARAGGRTQQTLDAEDLRQFFVEQLIDTLRGESPQLIAYRRGTLSGKIATETFPVNKGARKLVFKVSWQRGQSFDVRVFKDRVDVTNSAQSVSADFYRILAVNVPPRGARDSAAGEWQLRIAGKAGSAYEAAAIIDDKELRYRARLEPLHGEAGALLRLAVRIGADRRPIDGPVAVTATITRPQVAIGNVLAAGKPLKAGSRGAEPGMSNADRHVAAFLQDKKWRSRLRPVSETVQLEGDGSDGFRTTLTQATVPGVYRAVVRISGEDRELGRFERSETVTANVRLTEADRARSALTLRTLPRSRTIELTLRPADRDGNLLGPTFAADVSLALSAGKIDRGPDDLGDGRYRFVLSPAKGDDSMLTLAVLGRPLVTGTIRELRAMRRR